MAMGTTIVTNYGMATRLSIKTPVDGQDRFPDGIPAPTLALTEHIVYFTAVREGILAPR